ERKTDPGRRIEQMALQAAVVLRSADGGRRKSGQNRRRYGRRPARSAALNDAVEGISGSRRQGAGGAVDRRRISGHEHAGLEVEGLLVAFPIGAEKADSQSEI